MSIFFVILLEKVLTLVKMEKHPLYANLVQRCRDGSGTGVEALPYGCQKQQKADPQQSCPAEAAIRCVLSFLQLMELGVL